MSPPGIVRKNLEMQMTEKAIGTVTGIIASTCIAGTIREYRLYIEMPTSQGEPAHPD
jgi:hypothetical protein